MNTASQDRIIGIDVSRDWLDIHVLPDGKRLRLPNTNEGHARLVDLAQSVGVLVCFEATGGKEWRLWSALDAAGIATRQLPPAQIKAFAASWGTRAKTDRIDAELIARFMLFRPDAGRTLPCKDTSCQSVGIKARTTRGNTKTPSGADQGSWETGTGRYIRSH